VPFVTKLQYRFGTIGAVLQRACASEGFPMLKPKFSGLAAGALLSVRVFAVGTPVR